jgi:hypothetical protein
MRRNLRRKAKKLPRDADAQRKAVAAALSYIRTRRNKMRYASAYAAKLTIGSGVTEGTCGLMQLRVKRRGQSWEVPGLRGVLTLRGLAVGSVRHSLERLRGEAPRRGSRGGVIASIARDHFGRAAARVGLPLRALGERCPCGPARSVLPSVRDGGGHSAAAFQWSRDGVSQAAACVQTAVKTSIERSLLTLGGSRRSCTSSTGSSSRSGTREVACGADPRVDLRFSRGQRLAGPAGSRRP